VLVLFLAVPARLEDEEKIRREPIDAVRTVAE
jgi:hypothetical protein